MTPFSLIGLEDCVDGRSMIYLVAIGASTIIPRVRIAPSRRYRCTSPKAHRKSPIGAVAPCVSVARHLTTHIEALRLCGFGVWRTSKKAQDISAHRHDRHKW